MTNTERQAVCYKDLLVMEFSLRDCEPVVKGRARRSGLWAVEPRLGANTGSIRQCTFSTVLEYTQLG